MKHCVALERSFGFCTRVAIVRSLTVAARMFAPSPRLAPGLRARMLVRGDLWHTLLGTCRQRAFPSHRTGPRGAEKDQAHEPRYEKPPAHQSPDPRDQPLLAPARAQPHRLVRMGRGGLRPCGQGRQAHLPEHRVCRLSLVPRDGARDFRERSGRPGRQRPLYLRQSRSRGTARRGRDLHAGHHHDESGSRGLADVGLVDARSPSDLRWHLSAAGKLPARVRPHSRTLARQPIPTAGTGRPHSSPSRPVGCGRSTRRIDHSTGADRPHGGASGPVF
jgi:hypothetical protein